jgi:hypothetical protein
LAHLGPERSREIDIRMLPDFAGDVPTVGGLIGGSVTALLVTFFLVPTVYYLVERRRRATP